MRHSWFKKESTQTIVLAIFLLISSYAWSFELSITDKNVGIGFHPEYNHSFYYLYDIDAFGSLELNKSFTLASGIAMGQRWDIFAISAYASTEYAVPFFRSYIPMNLKFAYVFNGLPYIETYTHTLLPSFSLKWKYGGGTIGYIARFTSFDKESSALFESILAYSVYVNFYNTEKATIGVHIANFDDFSARNLASYSFYLDSKFQLNEHFFVTSNMEIALSGNVAQITSVYGIALHQGVIFKW